jgi:hypothetical protein
MIRPDVIGLLAAIAFFLFALRIRIKRSVNSQRY